MPENGVVQISHEEILTYDEITRISRCMTGLGIRKIKLTGGEPLIRKNCATLVRMLKELPGIEKVTLTTNGVLLEEQIADLAEAGLDDINISLDTLNAAEFAKVTRRESLDRVLEGIQAALQYPQIGLKINCVPVVEEQENLVSIARLAKQYPIHVRFIEMMPIGYGSSFAGMPQEKIMNLVEQKFGKMIPYNGKPLGNGPCTYYTVDGFEGKIGFISAISHKFCSQCNRIRLTSQGYLKTCLQYMAGRDLRAVLRNGGTDEELKDRIRAALAEKPDGHHFREKAKEDDTESLCMSQIGG